MKSINNLLKGPKEECVADEFIDNTGALVAQNDVCNYLNHYFANIGISNIGNEHHKPIWNVDDPGYVFDEVTLKDTLDVVKEIDVGKDSCIEEVSTLVIKICFGTLSRQLQYLFNVSLNECNFSREWAKGLINILP